MTMTTKEALDRATRAWLDARRTVISDRSGESRRDTLIALDEVNALRAPHLPPILAPEIEYWPGQLTEPE